MENEARSIPSWLEESPGSKVKPPVQTKIQELPFDKLTWENFERLCLRLVRKEANVEHCQLYGQRGDNQEGIDIYARLLDRDKYTVYQCKREKNFGPAKIKSAVDKFLKGKWAKRTNCFVLCTQESLRHKNRADEFKSQSEKLRNEGISFIAWDEDYLSNTLKNYPDIVEDFFGKPWVNAFCSKTQVDNVSNESEKDICVEEYQLWLAKKTSSFVIPTLGKTFSIATDWLPRKALCIQADKESFDVELITELYKRCLIIGNSASGKSTLVRRLANCLTQKRKKVLLVRLPDVLRLYQQGKTFTDAILDCSIDGSNIDHSLLRLALNNPDYLLADGLDECNTDRADIARKLMSWADGHSTTRVIVASRKNCIPESLSNWPQLELQQLNKEEIQKFFSKILSAASEEKSKLEEKLALIETIFQNEKTLSLAQESPLLAGFIIRLVLSDVDITQKNRTELYEAIVNLAYGHSPEFRKSIELSKRSAKRFFCVAGWKLMQKPSITEDELVEELVQELQTMGYTLQEAENETEKGIQFWEDKRIFCRSTFGHKDRVSFVHLSLCEYAAGKYVSQLNDTALQNWLKEAKRDSRWKETICFASSLGMGEKVVRCLLDLNDSRDLDFPEIILALAVTIENKNIPAELLETLISRIQPQLESSEPDNIFEITVGLLSILPKASNLIGDLAKTLLENDNFHTRIAATRLILACKEENICLDKLTQLIKEILSNPIPNMRLSFMIGDKGSKKYEWDIRNEIIFSGCQLLLKKRQNIETHNQILLLISECSFIGAGIVDSVKELLSNSASTKLQTEDAKEWISFLQKLTPSDSFPKKLKLESPKDILRKLKISERARLADKTFLESIFRIVGVPQEHEKLKYSSVGIELVALGTLFKGMGLWHIPITAWNILSNCDDPEAVDTVLKGMIIALDIDQERLMAEASKVLNDIERFFSFDLNSVKSVLQKDEYSERFFETLDYLSREIYQDKKASLAMYRHLPKVPVIYKWHLVTNIRLSSKVLVRAFEHPSAAISQNAALLVKYGAGGEEAVRLARKLVGEEEWESFEKM
ncbi:MAG: NACHT domain-containing protein [Spirulinaceae cyanobacterium]